MNAKIYLLFALSVLAVACTTLPKSVIPRDTIFYGWERGTPRISPDGTSIAYWGIVDDQKQLLVKDLKSGEEHMLGIWKLAVRRDVKDAIFWSHDGRRILFWADTKGDENYHLYSIEVENDAAFDLTPFPQTTTYVISRPENQPEILFIEANVQNKETFDLFKINTSKGTVDLEAKNPGNLRNWIIDAQGVVAGAILRSKTGASLKLFDSSTHQWKNTVALPQEFFVDDYFGCSKDGSKIWIASSYKNDKSRLYEVGVRTGTLRVLSEDREFDFGDVFIDPRTQEIGAVKYYKDKSRWEANPEYKEHFENLEKELSGHYRFVNFSQDGKNWVISTFNDVRAPAYYLYHLETKNLELLHAENSGLQKYQLSAMTPFQFSARDGLTVHGYYTLPNGPIAGTILRVHGGPNARDYWEFNQEVQWLASRGYAVIQVNFRGSTGYGKQFEFAGDREWGGKMLDDLIDAKKWAVKKKIADPDRFCILGYSYGGYAVMSALAFKPNQFRCGIAINGISDLKRFVEDVPPYWRPQIGELYRKIGVPGKDDLEMAARSPLKKADKIIAPLLLAHGKNDVRCKSEQSRWMFDALKSQGKPVQFLLMPDDGHLSSRRWGSVRVAIEDFLAKHLGGTAEPAHSWEMYDDLEQ